MKAIVRIDFSGSKDYIIDGKHNFNDISGKAQEQFYCQLQQFNKITDNEFSSIEIDHVWMAELCEEIENEQPKLKAIYNGALYNVSCIDYVQDFIALWNDEHKYFTVKISEIEKLIIKDE